MTSTQYKTETGVLYQMIQGVPHKLVTETIEVEGGIKVITKLVPAAKQGDTDNE